MITGTKFYVDPFGGENSDGYDDFIMSAEEFAKMIVAYTEVGVPLDMYAYDASTQCTRRTYEDEAGNRIFAYIPQTDLR